jgi:curved DNA-binding protein CbpA
MGGKKPDIDYYVVLGLEKTATMDDIKRAYRELAKKYHPDVNTTGEAHLPNAAKFREIAEAYAVLSVPENKTSYDTSFSRQNDSEQSKVKSAVMEENRKNRDRSGFVPGPTPMRGSYAEYRLKKLEKERQQFNVNHLGYYNGGLPRKDSGNIRGEAMSSPGTAHSALSHNAEVRFEREAFEVTNSRASEFKAFNVYDNLEGKRDEPKAYHPLEHDYTWKYVRQRRYGSMIIFSIIAYYYARRVYERERMRMVRNQRQPESLYDLPSHHFVNRGGVLIKKEFVGFAKYFKNDKELTDWYWKVYPDLMKNGE